MPPKIQEWLEKNLARVVFGAIVVFAVVLLLVLHSCQRAQTAKTEAKLATGQAGAAIQSGQDAVNTIGNRMSSDSASDDLTKENADAIRNAQGSDAPVTAAVRDAGLASLCKRAAYKRDPKCVQYAHP